MFLKLACIVLLNFSYFTISFANTDILFAKNCVKKTVDGIYQNSRHQLTETHELHFIGNRQRELTAEYKSLLAQTQVKFPKGAVLNMRSNEAVASEGKINDAFAQALNLNSFRDSVEQHKETLDIIRSKKNFSGSFDEYAALLSYKANYYRKINGFLRSEVSESASQEASFVTLIRYINSALNRLPVYEGVVYRGTVLPESESLKFDAGRLFSPTTFFSTSINSPSFMSPDTEHRVMFILRSRTGRTIEKATDPFADGIRYGEGEVLFKPRVIFKTLKVEREKNLTKVYAEEMV